MIAYIFPLYRTQLSEETFKIDLFAEQWKCNLVQDSIGGLLQMFTTWFPAILISCCCYKYLLISVYIVIWVARQFYTRMEYSLAETYLFQRKYQFLIFQQTVCDRFCLWLLWVHHHQQQHQCWLAQVFSKIAMVYGDKPNIKLWWWSE